MRLVGKSKINARLNEIESKLGDIVDVAGDRFRQATPIDTGNARSKTYVRGNRVEADYAYAVRLNTGWSRQAPNGMTDTTIEAIRDYVKRI